MNLTKLQMALRRNDGKRLLPGFLEEVAESLGKPQDAIQRLELEETLVSMEAYRVALDRSSQGEIPSQRWDWTGQEVQRLADLSARARDTVNLLPMLLYRSLSEYCGAVKTDSREILDRAIHLTSLDQEELMASTHDASDGILLAHLSEPTLGHEQEIYILRVWGPQLLKAFETM